MTNVLFNAVYKIKNIDIKNINSIFTKNLDLDINQQDKNGNTILHILFSIEKNDDVVIEFTKILLNMGVNIFIHNKKKQIPDNILIKNSNKKLRNIIFLLVHDSEQYMNSIYYYSHWVDYPKIKEIINEQKYLLNTKMSLFDGNVNCCPLMYLSIVHYHSENACENICKIIKLFVENGANINEINNENDDDDDEKKNNILHLFIENGILYTEENLQCYNFGHKKCLCLKKIIDCLIKNGINVNHKNSKCETPLKLLCNIKYSYDKYGSDIISIFDTLIDNTYIDKKEYDELVKKFIQSEK